MRKTSHGYYLYRSRVFARRVDALEAARLDGEGASSLSLWLNDDVLARIDTRVEPEPSLTELYHRRARELRERHDYIVLMYSGGADSHQVLRAFLDSNTHLDEVRTRYPLGCLSGVDVTPNPRHDLGLLFEYRLAALPGLREVARRSPRTRVNVVDTTSLYVDGLREDWLPAVDDFFRLNGGLYHAFRAMSEVDELRREELRSACVVTGADKPRLVFGDTVSFEFDDGGLSGRQHVGEDYEAEMFYWGCPEIVVKQCHVTLRRIAEDPALFDFVAARRYIPEHVLATLVYPDWDGRYQKRVKHRDEGILDLMGISARGVNAAKNRHYNARYAGVPGVNSLDDDGQRLLCVVRSRRYPVGRLRRKIREIPEDL